MNKILLIVGGAFNLLFVAFHLALLSPIGAALTSVAPDIQATVSTLNIQLAFALLIFAYLDIFQWRDLLTTRLGNITALAISLFWILRGINQVVFYGLTAAGIPLFGLCLVFGLLHLIPLIRARRPFPGEAPPQVDTHVDRIGAMPWARYAAVAWCVVFGALHLYWALGGTVGFAEFSMPSNRTLALARDPLYVGITWAVVILCVIAAFVALAPFQSWSRRIPRWLLLTPLWIASGLFLLRGIGNPVQSALIIAGGMPFEPLAGPDAQAWYQWLLIDAVLYAPWFILGGLAFGATALSAPRHADALAPGMAS